VSQELRRPDPERLLQQVMAQERQTERERLKVFLGYASGVGKSLRMLDEARRRCERGQDVVIAAIQKERGAQIDALLCSIEQIPMKVVEGVPVVDVEAVLARSPKVCIVDAAASDNPPGSRHAHRWEDIKELVESGIAVITSLNLQHVAEEQERVQRITGRHVAEVVPKSFLYLADEITVVDVPSEALMERVGSSSDDLTYARRLSELREMTLLLAAEIVDRQLEDYLKDHGIDLAWGTQERILVCITPRADAARMLASGRRNADRFHGSLLLLYVPEGDLSDTDEQALRRSLEEGKRLGAEIHVLDDADTDDPVDAILEFTRSHRITQLFVGHGTRNWRHWLSGSPLDRLIRGAEGIDIRVFPH
jgi:two-component system, OmpR family, sensor histidine kinase KdpD